MPLDSNPMDATSLTLLGQARGGSPDAWAALDRLYRPFVARWLLRQGVPPADADDLTQDVLAVLVRELPAFDHNGRTGAFRAWLRGVCLNRVQGFRRRQRLRAGAEGGTDFQRRMGEVPDATAEADDWDREHDRHVLRELLASLSGEFEEKSLTAFRRLTLDGATGPQVAGELGTTTAAVLMAKSRILRRLRELAAGLVDEDALA